jgi:uncharacterized protein
MRSLFADTSYWVALFYPRDRWHKQALSLSRTWDDCRLYTTDEVLAEFLTFCSGNVPHARTDAVRLVQRVLTDPGITVLSQTRASFLEALDFYASRPDKRYSLTDCIAMNVMRREEITEVLSNDRHFTQEGFTLVLDE